MVMHARRAAPAVACGHRLGPMDAAVSPSGATAAPGPHHAPHYLYPMGRTRGGRTRSCDHRQAAADGRAACDGRLGARVGRWPQPMRLRWRDEAAMAR